MSEMKMSQIFDKNDWDHLHDCILDATFNTTKRNCNKKELEEIFNQLPIEMKVEAYKFGMSDTLWRDNFIIWYKNNM